MQQTNEYSVYELARIIACHRPWFSRMFYSDRGELHPCVVAMLNRGDRPLDWHRLTLEWPHVSQEEPSMLAYVRDERSGENSRFTRTGKIAGYLKRHWPQVSDNVLRDVVALWNTNKAGGCSFLDKCTEAYVDAVMNGPNSCMKWNHVDTPSHHPYSVYDPDLGWEMAVHKKDGLIIGRALVYGGRPLPEGKRVFVRSFRACDDNPYSTGYSHSDTDLESWLKAQGIEHKRSWPDGTRLARLPHRHGGWMAPYIDGDEQHVDVRSDYLVIDCDGEYLAENTDGTLGEPSAVSCDVCDSRVDEEDTTYVEYRRTNGRMWSGTVCSCCIDDSFTYVNYGYAHNDHVTTAIDGTVWVTADGSPDSYVEITEGSREGEFDHMDNSLELVDGGWVHQEDEGDYVQLDTRDDDYERYAFRGDCTEVEDCWVQTCNLDDLCIEVTAGSCSGTYMFKEDHTFYEDQYGQVWHEDDLIEADQALVTKEPFLVCVAVDSLSCSNDPLYAAFNVAPFADEDNPPMRVVLVDDALYTQEDIDERAVIFNFDTGHWERAQMSLEFVLPATATVTN